MTLKVLIAEDSPRVAEVVAFGARMNWPDCQVTIAQSGAETLNSFRREPPDLVVLDIAMPPPDGFAVCQQIREASQVPILMLTVRDQTEDKVRALDLGADDYLAKPFDHIELLARMRALVRRTKKAMPPDAAPVRVGDLSLDPNTREVRLRGEVICLTAAEYRLLEALMNHAGSVVPHKHLLQKVWESEYLPDVRYLKVLVGRLRRKLGDDAEQPRYIFSEWGIGYRFAPPS